MCLDRDEEGDGVKNSLGSLSVVPYTISAAVEDIYPP